jgi:hypothetical protein
MQYADLLAAYNTQKKKLLIPAIISKNLPAMSKVDQDLYFHDFRFYNPRLSFEENTRVKQAAAKELNYTYDIKFGDIQSHILYCHAVGRGNTIERYLILGGLIKRTGDISYKTKYKGGEIIDTTY